VKLTLLLAVYAQDPGFAALWLHRPRPLTPSCLAHRAARLAEENVV